ncbi:winged helix-turn-helix transcriptional regulator [archaeon]|jgi:DNA-binding transcriptional ArsR family regulator|nr:winged helix-turn-helix transcriptional regulator [archaeon]MBT4373445.1 winged helix-turn-helix transcriptional regulator [archaeon]MBT4531893.1 winged helix-turn-helix transcriptional regulator [archaeon]MBT7001560.1 winged helix-turn-helix transcriptional regulator [archaeon]MBT7282548.1 winged helix-turn-helix transcriptional regulator [archaeon]
MLKSTYHVFFSNLANPLRVEIVSQLKEKPRSVGEISRELKVEQSKVSHALASLKSCNIVDFKQKGKQRIYSLNKKTILPILKLIDKHSKTYCSGNCKFCGGGK